MSREIEFRGYDLDLKKWVYGGYHKHIKRQIAPFGDELKEEDIQHLIIIDGFADWNMPQPVHVVTNIDKNSVGQYTGLKDKNGVKIFEGDIVKVDYLQEKIFEIIFVNGGFKLKAKDCSTEYDYSITPTMIEENAIEVIGNIYENKELLEAKNECRN